MSSPNLFNKAKGISKRQRAHALFLKGKNLDEVCAELDLKRSTGSCYLFEARLIHEQNQKLLKKDDLLK